MNIISEPNETKDRDKTKKVIKAPDFPNDLPGEKIILPPESGKREAGHNQHAEPNEKQVKRDFDTTSDELKQ